MLPTARLLKILSLKTIMGNKQTIMGADVVVHKLILTL